MPDSGLLQIDVAGISKAPYLEPELHGRKRSCLPYTKLQAYKVEAILLKLKGKQATDIKR